MIDTDTVWLASRPEPAAGGSAVTAPSAPPMTGAVGASAVTPLGPMPASTAASVTSRNSPGWSAVGGNFLAM